MLEMLETLLGDKGALEAEMLQSLAPLARERRQALAEHVIVNQAVGEIERKRLARSRKRQLLELQIINRRFEIVELERM